MTELATTIPPEAKFKIHKSGIAFEPDCPLEDWRALGEHLSRMNRCVGFLVGDWLNFGERVYGDCKKAAAELGFEYQTVADYSYVARNVELSVRTETLEFNHHRVVAKLKPEDQKKWLATAAESKLGYRRLQKSINFGRIATEEEMKPDPADKGQTFYILFVNRLCQWFAKRTEHDPVGKWTDELRAMLKRDLQPVVDIYNSL